MSYADHPDPEAVIRAMRLDLADGIERDPDPRAVLRTAPFFDRDEVHEVYRAWRRVLDEYPRRAGHGGRGLGLPGVAHDGLRPRPTSCPGVQLRLHGRALGRRGDRRAIASVLERSALVGAPATWVLSNHDTPRVVTRLGGASAGLRRALALAHVAHALPGGVYVFAGEELGLPDAAIPDDRRQDPIWRAVGVHRSRARRGAGPAALVGRGAALRLHHGADSWLPAPDGWAQRRWRRRTQDADSTLATYRRLIGAARQCTRRSPTRTRPWSCARSAAS